MLWLQYGAQHWCCGYSIIHNADAVATVLYTTLMLWLQYGTQHWCCGYSMVHNTDAMATVVCVVYNHHNIMTVRYSSVSIKLMYLHDNTVGIASVVSMATPPVCIYYWLHLQSSGEGAPARQEEAGLKFNTATVPEVSEGEQSQIPRLWLDNFQAPVGVKTDLVHPPWFTFIEA